MIGSSLLALVLASVIGAQAADLIVETPVNIRETPTSKARKLSVAHPPERLRRLSPDALNGYYNIATDSGVEGWVWSKAVRVDAEIQRSVTASTGGSEDPEPKAATRPTTGAEVLWLGMIVGLLLVAGGAAGFLCHRLFSRHWLVIGRDEYVHLSTNSAPQETSTGDIDVYVKLLLEEYKSLRAESQQISVNMFTSMQFGTAFLGVIVAAALTKWSEVPAASVVGFLIVLPVLSAVALLIWLGEAVRFKRVGEYLCFVEQKAGLITTALRQKLTIVPQSTLQGLELEFPLLWEQWLARGGHVSLVYLVRFTVFPALVLLCAGIGCVALLETRSSDIANSPVFQVVLAGAWVVIGLCGGMALPAAWSLFGKSGFVRPAAKESDLRPALDLGQSK